MEPENLDIESIMDARRETVEQTIQPIGIDELKSLGEKVFPFLDHPWRHMFFQFLEENSGSTVYHATTNDRLKFFTVLTKMQACGSSHKEVSVSCRPGNTGS